MLSFTKQLEAIPTFNAAQSPLQFIVGNDDSQLLAGVKGSATLSFFSGYSATDGDYFILEGIQFVFKTTPVYPFEIKIGSYSQQAYRFKTAYLQSAYLQSQLTYTSSTGGGVMSFTFTKKTTERDIEIEQYTGFIAAVSIVNDATYFPNSSKTNIGVKVGIYDAATGDLIDTFNKLFFLILSADKTTVTSATAEFDLQGYLGDVFSRSLPSIAAKTIPMAGMKANLFIETTENWKVGEVTEQGFIASSDEFIVFESVEIPVADYRFIDENSNILQSFYTGSKEGKCNYTFAPAWVWVDLGERETRTVKWVFKNSAGITLYTDTETITEEGWHAVASSVYQFLDELELADVEPKEITTLEIEYEKTEIEEDSHAVASSVYQFLDELELADVEPKETEGAELLSLANYSTNFCFCSGEVFIFLSKYGTYETIQLRELHSEKRSLKRDNFQYANTDILELVNLESQASFKAYFKEPTAYASTTEDANDFILDFIESPEAYWFKNQELLQIEIFTSTVDSYAAFSKINESVEWRLAKSYGIKK